MVHEVMVIGDDFLIFFGGWDNTFTIVSFCMLLMNHFCTFYVVPSSVVRVHCWPQRTNKPTAANNIPTIHKKSSYDSPFMDEPHPQVDVRVTNTQCPPAAHHTTAGCLLLLSYG
jgi:hypothetical protein